MDLGSVLARMTGPIALIVSVLILIVNASFAGAVARDAMEVFRRRGSTILVTPVIWTLATLVGGVFVAAIYWVLHHGTMGPRQD